MPDTVFIQENDASMTYGVNQDPGVKDMHTYIRKDVVKHIIRGARGPQDALNKIESL